MGDMTCPAGFIVEADVAPTHKPNFEDELCPAPILSFPYDENPVQVARNQTVWIDLYGTQFSPYACAGASPPCQGPQVEIQFAHVEDPDIHVRQVEWHDIGHLRIQVEVEDDARLGRRDIFVRNPVGGAGSDTSEDAFDVVPASS